MIKPVLSVCWLDLLQYIFILSSFLNSVQQWRGLVITSHDAWLVTLSNLSIPWSLGPTTPVHDISHYN